MGEGTDQYDRLARLIESQRVFYDLRAPDFTLPDLAGEYHSFSAQRGKKVVLALWASW